MRKRLLVLAGFVFAVSTAYLAGQQKPLLPESKKLPGGATAVVGGVVLFGENVGFLVEGRPYELPDAGRGWVTGKFVVKIDGKWVEARPASGLVPVPAR